MLVTEAVVQQAVALAHLDLRALAEHPDAGQAVPDLVRLQHS